MDGIARDAKAAAIRLTVVEVITVFPPIAGQSSKVTGEGDSVV
jgi:hypothetical protein